MTPTCSTCRYFVPDEPEESEYAFDERPSRDPIEEPDDSIDSGTCHFHAPQSVMYCFLPTPEGQNLMMLRDKATNIRQAMSEGGDGKELQEQLDETLEALEEAQSPDTTAIWPAVDASDYCGEYKMIDRKKK